MHWETKARGRVLDALEHIRFDEVRAVVYVKRLEGHFSGTLWLTNAPGSTAIRNKSDLTGALVKGSFEISGRTANFVDQAFVP